jgi:hypothetical protein
MPNDLDTISVSELHLASGGSMMSRSQARDWIREGCIQAYAQGREDQSAELSGTGSDPAVAKPNKAFEHRAIEACNLGVQNFRTRTGG